MLFPVDGTADCGIGMDGCVSPAFFKLAAWTSSAETKNFPVEFIVSHVLNLEYTYIRAKHRRVPSSQPHKMTRKRRRRVSHQPQWAEHRTHCPIAGHAEVNPFSVAQLRCRGQIVLLPAGQRAGIVPGEVDADTAIPGFGLYGILQNALKTI